MRASGSLQMLAAAAAIQVAAKYTVPLVQGVQGVHFVQMPLVPSRLNPCGKTLLCLPRDFHSHTYSVRDSIFIEVLGYVYLQHTHPRLHHRHTFGVRPEAPAVPRGLGHGRCQRPGTFQRSGVGSLPAPLAGEAVLRHPSPAGVRGGEVWDIQGMEKGSLFVHPRVISFRILSHPGGGRMSGEAGQMGGTSNLADTPKPTPKNTQHHDSDAPPPVQSVQWVHSVQCHWLRSRPGCPLSTVLCTATSSLGENFVEDSVSLRRCCPLSTVLCTATSSLGEEGFGLGF